MPQSAFARRLPPFRRGVLALTLGAVALLPAARAEDEETPPDHNALILSAIDKARDAFRAGKAQEAVRELQKAIKLIQQTAMRGLASFLPDLGEGWTADEPNTTSGSWNVNGTDMQWTQVTRTYRHEERNLGLDIMITTSPQMMQGTQAMLQMFKNPQMRAAFENDKKKKHELVEGDGWSGILITEGRRRTSFQTCCEGVLLTMEVATGDAALVRQVWQAMDRRGLAESTRDG